METEGSLPPSQVSIWIFRNKMRLCAEELLASRPTPKLEDHPLLAVHACLFNIFVATLHSSSRVEVQFLTSLFLIGKVLGSSLLVDTGSANSDLSSFAQVFHPNTMTTLNQNMTFSFHVLPIFIVHYYSCQLVSREEYSV
jgi:hypothetical protein